MTRAAKSIYIFGIYLIVTAGFMLGAPDTFLRLLGQPPATEPWFRILGVVVMVLGMLDLASAKGEQTAYFRASVWTRFFAAIAFTALVVLKLAPTVLILFAVVDAACAVWTKVALARA